jgi:membrane protease YdiL (CAAX protease family)
VLLLGSAANGFAEELVMRGYLFPRLERLLGSSFRSLIVTTLLFAAYHVYQGTAGVLSALSFGLVYGLAFWKLRRLWPLALGHAIADYAPFAWQ